MRSRTRVSYNTGGEQYLVYLFLHRVRHTASARSATLLTLGCAPRSSFSLHSHLYAAISSIHAYLAFAPRTIHISLSHGFPQFVSSSTPVDTHGRSLAPASAPNTNSPCASRFRSSLFATLPLVSPDHSWPPCPPVKMRGFGAARGALNTLTQSWTRSQRPSLLRLNGANST